MLRFQVPQFITVEDKIIGPLTIKQSLYVGAGILLIMGVRYFFVPVLFWPLAALIGGVFGALAFLKINEQPLFIVIKNALSYFMKPRLYRWQKEVVKKEKEKKLEKKEKEVLIKSIPKLSSSKLSDLAWSLDIKEKLGRE